MRRVVIVKNSAEGDFGIKDETGDADPCECLKAAGGTRVVSRNE